MPIQLDTVGVVVRDMGKALDFYRLLGLLIPDDNGEPHVEITTAGLTLGFDLEAMVRQLDSQWVEPTGQRLNLQFRCGSARDVDTTFERLTAAGHLGYQAPWDAFWGQRFARVTDPDGNVVNLFAPLDE